MKGSHFNKGTALAALGMALSVLSPAWSEGLETLKPLPAGSAGANVVPAGAREGYELFNHNCAACHGEDARGDEGPSLYNLSKSDARISAIIKGGIKGEMPAFARKFSEADVRVLIAYIRTLKD